MRKLTRRGLRQGPGLKVKDIARQDAEIASTRQADVKRDDISTEGPKLPGMATGLRESTVNILPPCSAMVCELETRAEESVKESKQDKIETLELTQKGSQPVGDEATTELPGIPLGRSRHNKGRGVIFVLEKASLTLAQVGKKLQILNSNEHADYMRKKKLNPYNCRPDIIHEALMEIQDSRLCMAGRVKAIYVKTDQGILIKIEPNAKIPRTLECFCDMMAELLQKFSIKAKGKHGKLLRLVANPVTQHLPANCLKIGLSSSSEKTVDFRDYIKETRSDADLVLVVGAMAHGEIDGDYTDDLVSVIGRPLTAGVCLRHIRVALERMWGIR